MEPYYRLTVVSEYLRGTTFELSLEVHACGRNKRDVDIFINDPSVSGTHCNFTKRVSSYYAVDLGSTNGTRVDNVPITSETRLKDGDIVTVGCVEMLYQTSEKATRKSVLDRTGLDLRKFDSTDTLVARTMDVTGMANLSPFESRSSTAFNAIAKATIAVLVALVLVLLAYLVYCVKAPADQRQAPVSAIRR